MFRTFLIKPASGACNLACRYCFYNDEGENRSIRNYGMMDRETAHILIDKALAGGDGASFGFQGGEPTLAGLDFFRDFSDYAGTKADRRKFSFALQTNGYTLDDEWADFFRDAHFLIGLSLDGNLKCHDENRVDHQGRGSFKTVFNNARLLQRHKVDFNILTTTTRQIASRIDELYAFYKRNGFSYLQFTPCIDPIAEERGSQPWSLTSEDYGRFLIRLFRLYHRDWKNGEYVSIRYFDNLISLMITGWAEECGLNGICGSYYVIEADGSVFPCDFYVLDGYRIGNIRTDSFEELDRRRQEIGFVEKSKTVHEDCRNCRYYRLCRGGCRRDREDFSTGTIGKTYLCKAFRTFFDSCLDGLVEMAQAEARARRGAR